MPILPFRLRLAAALLVASLAYAVAPPLAYAEKGGGDHGSGDDHGGDDHDDGDDDGGNDDGGNDDHGDDDGGSGGNSGGGSKGNNASKTGGGSSNGGGGGDDDDDHDRARTLVERGEIHSLQEIVRGLAKKVPGEIVGVRLHRTGNVWIYSFRIVAKGGKLVFVDVDAKKMSILRKAGR